MIVASVAIRLIAGLGAAQELATGEAMGIAESEPVV